MSLSDIMGHVDLSVYPELALVIFVGVFVMVLVRTLRESSKVTDRMAMLPIAEHAEPSERVSK